MSQQHPLIEDLHKEMETVHQSLTQYDGVKLENGYHTGIEMPEQETPEEYRNMLESQENFEEKGGLLRTASTYEEMASMILDVSGAEYVTLGQVPIEGPIGESLVDNVNLDYRVRKEEGETQPYWTVDSELIDEDNRESRDTVQGIESIVRETTSAEVQSTPLESVNQGIEQMLSRAE